jgi:drug/metabolite transporter (DMT)-like permease
VSRKGWLLFAAMCVIWGIPYLLIKVADESVSVPVVVFSRTALGALVLLPATLRSGQLGALRRHWRPMVAFTALEMIGPWGLLSAAEKRIPSSLAGLLIAAVPMIGVVIGRLTGGTEVLSPRRWTGLVIGLAGVAVLAGPHLSGSGWPITEVLLVTVGYASAPLIAARRLAEVPVLPMTTACLSMAALVYAPAAILSLPSRVPPGRVLASLAALGVVCTACVPGDGVHVHQSGGGRRRRRRPAGRAVHRHGRRLVRADPGRLLLCDQHRTRARPGRCR